MNGRELWTGATSEFRRRSAGRWAGARLLAGLAVLLASVAVLALLWTVRYEPPVAAAPGHELHLATQPGQIEGVAKALQQRFEGTPCNYTILEWDEEGTLYYQSDCVSLFGHPVWGPDGDGSRVSKRAQRRVWAFSPYIDGNARLVAASPNGLVHEPRRGENHQWSMGVAGLVSRPRDISIVNGPPMASSDAQWFAAVITRLYRPQDVVVVSQ